MYHSTSLTVSVTRRAVSRLRTSVTLQPPLKVVHHARCTTPNTVVARSFSSRSSGKISRSFSTPVLETYDYQDFGALPLMPMPPLVPTPKVARQAFPSIIIGPDEVQPQGSFAEAQTQYMNPDLDTIHELHDKLSRANMGIVAHYYMDVELQSALQTLKDEPYGYGACHIADSLAMGDAAVNMCRDHGVTSIACLGVDFMSESVSAIMEKAGYGHVPVYRAAQKEIGCSLAEAAEGPQYRAWLEKAAKQKNPLHVVYINTSLETKAVSSITIPTITCTSSNVVRTMLQASSQVEDLKIFYGPDTYMGENIVTMLDSIVNTWDDDRISGLHPLHNRKTLAKLRDSIDVYPNGNCVVHHMFGGEVVRTVREQYDDAFVTAHLEVPGEMFEIAMEKSLDGRGAVGSTSDILNFISGKVAEAARSNKAKRLKFVLGTEAGMVTAIVRSVQDILAESLAENDTGGRVEAEIIFPVASEAVTPVGGDADMVVVPGVPAGEGCSTAGGCAMCPFMKMNDLDAVMDVADLLLEGKDMRGYLPPQRLKGKTLDGRKAVDVGAEPIMHMRHFMLENALPDKLVERITSSP